MDTQTNDSKIRIEAKLDEGMENAKTHIVGYKRVDHAIGGAARFNMVC